MQKFGNQQKRGLSLESRYEMMVYRRRICLNVVAVYNWWLRSKGLHVVFLLSSFDPFNVPTYPVFVGIKLYVILESQ